MAKAGIKKKRKPKKKPAAKKLKGFLKRLFRYTAVIVALIIMLPLALSVLYRIEGVKPISTLMLTRTLTLKPVNRHWAAIEDIAPALVQSVIMSEDGKFCSHNGVDWNALTTVIDGALDGARTRGASTLTMQTVKNLFLWNSRSYLRKGLEIPLALWFDLVVPKKRILEIYLNIAEWDEVVFGAEAASRLYFKRSAENLTYRQAALLTTTLPNPRNRDAAKPSRHMIQVAKIINRRAKSSRAYIGCVQ
ncbi:MAG: monofunctional biosynthetic peptidoglycan transglycosylase [Rhizobiaceae bacterium]